MCSCCQQTVLKFHLWDLTTISWRPVAPFLCLLEWWCFFACMLLHAFQRCKTMKLILLYTVKYISKCINWDKIVELWVVVRSCRLSQVSFDVDLTQAAIDGVHSMCPNKLMIRMQNWAGTMAGMDASVHLNLNTKDPWAVCHILLAKRPLHHITCTVRCLLAWAPQPSNMMLCVGGSEALFECAQLCVDV